jgi:diguanylate cyclase (GGDEF)-like protein/PAS domain S-box-containing protein
VIFQENRFSLFLIVLSRRWPSRSGGEERSADVTYYRGHLFVLCVLTVFLLSGAHSGFKHVLIDLRFDWFPRQASADIVLIEIDPRSIDQIGVWPWPRSLHGELIQKLESAGVSEIAFDVDFSSPSTPASDRAFLDALKKARGSVILPSFKQFVHGPDGQSRVHVNFPLPQFAKFSWPATVNVITELAGTVRHYPFGERLDGKFYPSLGALLAGSYETNEKHFLIDFSIRPESVSRISYVDVLRGDAGANRTLLEGKKVVIGATAIELGDRLNVPNYGMIPGPTLQVLAAESINQGRVLRSSAAIVSLAGLGLITLLMIVLRPRLTAGVRAGILVGCALSAEAVATVVQVNLPVIVDTTLWHVAIITYLIAIALDEIDLRGLLAKIAESRFHRIAMSLGDGLACADQDGRITVWNPAAEAIFGYQASEMIGQPLAKICASGDDASRATPLLIDTLAKDELTAPGGKVIELEGLKKNGETFPLEVCFSGWLGIDGFQYGAALRDISVRKREEQRIRHLAEHDTLTRLANRHALHEHLNAKLEDAKIERLEIGLLLFDLDKFKDINNTLGHSYGDQLLRALAAQLEILAYDADLVARLGGDEFAIVVSGTDAAGKAQRLAERISLALQDKPISVGERGHRMTASIGVALYPQDAQSRDELLANADLALYRAKGTGRSQHVFFHSEIRNELEARLSLEAELRRAVERNEFELFYQPQFDLKHYRLVGVEALVRWRHPDRGLVPPAEFMPVINASTISDDVALWIMQTACAQGRIWQQRGYDIRIGVNLSPSQFKSGDLAATVSAVLKETGFAPSLLELEVTEDILLDDDEAALELFRRIQDLGVHLAFDDFGTGYASLTYLKKFPLNRLKVDQSFVRELHAGSSDAAIVGSTIELSKLLGLSVIAEGIEDRATADLLLNMGCDEGQGYHFGRPMPAAEFYRTFFAGSSAQRSAHAG